MANYDYLRNKKYEEFRGIENLSEIDRNRLYELRDRIDLNRQEWNKQTNSYAYSLGIDATNMEILPANFMPGLLGAAIKGIDIDSLKTMKPKEKVFLDLDALNIYYEPCFSYKETSNDYDKWVIAMYERLCNNYKVHFLRKTKDGIWVHKNAHSDVIFTDDNGAYMYDISENRFGFNNELYENYDFVGSYKLELRK